MFLEHFPFSFNINCQISRATSNTTLMNDGFEVELKPANDHQWTLLYPHSLKGFINSVQRNGNIIFRVKYNFRAPKILSVSFSNTVSLLKRLAMFWKASSCNLSRNHYCQWCKLQRYPISVVWSGFTASFEFRTIGYIGEFEKYVYFLEKSGNY